MKQEDNNIARRIKLSIKAIDPKAQVIIFGSRARGDAKEESDWDILILTDYPVSTEIERSFRNKLFDLEIETGEVFSTFVYHKMIWNSLHKVTPLYRNIKKEGVRIWQTPKKQDYITYRLNSAKETLDAARLLAENQHWNSAINRLYYSCFYAISALLYKYDINASSHAGLKHQFTLHFIKSGLIDKELGRVFVELFDWRQKGDYGDFYDFDREKVMPLFIPVEKIIGTVESLITNKK
jgi:uncharacterized protein